ncbi:hypothetical protein HOLleu_04129 [Holothuria leucospilota]|uniref:Uncharacterized protein n=1 Tax=Holothuria leucospilota TaxID=206669 RepID=A0A9Q1CRL9_HOLLE|nr:hypothetical protein HOLleu_04129 [Holothuria leucospilota]
MKFVLITLLAAAASASFAPLYTDKERIDGSYIIVLKEGVSLTSTLRSLENDPYFTTFGGRIEKVYGNVLNGFSASLGEKALEYIRQLNIVSYVEEDGMVYAQAVESWGLDRVDQRNLPLNDGFTPRGTGAGAHVYVIDTGIRESHNDFGGRASIATDTCRTPNVSNGVDCHGHGTHCAGTVGGKDYGVAKSASLYGVRVLNCQGSGYKSDTIAGMNWVKANRNNPAVVSMSLGGSASTAQDDAVADLDADGVIVIVAAGNDNSDACNGSPSRAEKAFTVGATDNSDARASYSNYGSCVNIFAPGSSIKSAWYLTDSSSRTISGTSMATPHVSGAAAVLLGIDNTLTPANVKNKLETEATSNCVSDVQGSPNKMLYIG